MSGLTGTFPTNFTGDFSGLTYAILTCRIAGACAESNLLVDHHVSSTWKVHLKLNWLSSVFSTSRSLNFHLNTVTATFPSAVVGLPSIR
jgi:hypothetical protein